MRERDKMKIHNMNLHKISIYDIAQVQQNSKQKTLFNTVAVKTRNTAKDNAQNFFNRIKSVHKL
ncbi:hypothetical protein LCGC14_2535660 [marine sediment metagenome]|uniref:Uncharacterized protein n=1 Tax=marine sediment metagenome TaxID=412755 RepID=A0A0F9D3S7_9ZZZZ